ncbi:MAG: serine/threonine-protein phosphatase [Anaerolineales bacterium]|nr:serine/threonine-protein phosphatase [Anaerolineales bacterium]
MEQYHLQTTTSVIPSAGAPLRSLLSTAAEVPGILTAAGISDTGTRRDENQDGFRMAGAAARNGRMRALFAVADGMGGLAQGRFASHVALQVFFESFLRNHSSSVVRAMRTAVEEADFGLQQAMRQLGIPRMGTTLTAACLEDGRLHLLHVGDSRAYQIRGGGIECLTHDHTTVGEMVRLHVLGPEKVRAHERRSELTRGLGLSLFLRPDTATRDLHGDDRILLCTDGVWSALEDGEIAACSAGAASPLEFGRSLIDLALERGSDDNVSAIVIQAKSPAPARSAAGGLWGRLFRHRTGH